MTVVTITIRRTRRLSVVDEPVVTADPQEQLGEYLTINEVCEWLGITGNTLLAWRRNRAFPTIEIDGFVRFQRDAARAWLAAHDSSTSAPTPLRRSA